MTELVLGTLIGSVAVGIISAFISYVYAWDIKGKHQDEVDTLFRNDSRKHYDLMEARAKIKTLEDELRVARISKSLQKYREEKVIEAIADGFNKLYEEQQRFNVEIDELKKIINDLEKVTNVNIASVHTFDNRKKESQ